jgi:hypothetical protein
MTAAASLANRPDFTGTSLDRGRIKSYFALIPLTGIRRRIRARVGFACFRVIEALR